MNGAQIGVYAGSFDPPTLGHLDIINQAKKLFCIVNVMVASNPGKGKRLLDADKTAELLKKMGADVVSICPPNRYVADLVVEQSANHATLVRGLRDASDVGMEIQLRRANAVIAPSLQTVYFVSSPEVAHVSSTAVRGLMGSGIDGWERVVAQYVTPEVLQALRDSRK